MTATTKKPRRTAAYDRLAKAYGAASTHSAGCTDPYCGCSDRTDDAFHALCDYVDDHGLTYTALDPRGPDTPAEPDPVVQLEQGRARRIARATGGIAVTRDRWHGRWERTNEWIVALPDGRIVDHTNADQYPEEPLS